MRAGGPGGLVAATAGAQQRSGGGHNNNAADSSSRGYSASRNERLHQLRQKRTPASDHALDRQPAGAAGAGARGGSGADNNSNSSVGRTTGAPTTNTAAKAVRLSSVLQQAPQHFDRVKVAAVERMLTDIDELPELFQSAEILYLSKNCLTQLQGVQQFSRLRVLSLADNLLQDISSLEVLTACPHLQVASFERNPLTGLPNYSCKVLQLLPHLETLDGQVVTPQERSKVHHVLQQEAACMAVMLSNACMVHKLARSAELLQLHTELRRTMFGSSSLARTTRGVLPSCIPLDLLKFLKLWDYEGGLSSEEHRVICDALTREVVRVHKQLQHAAAALKGPAQLPALQAWDTAFAKVMLAQQRTIIQLVELVNVLHGEAASLVSKLTGQQQHPDGSPEQLLQQEQEQEQQHDQQGHAAEEDQRRTPDQQLAQDREDLIIDLRDAALELAGLIAAGETASDAALRCSESLSGSGSSCPSPQRLVRQQRERQQQQQQAAAAAAAGSESPAAAAEAGSSSRQKQQQQQRGVKDSPQQSAAGPRGSISLRRRSSGGSHEALRLRPSPKPDRTISSRAAAASRIPQPPGVRAAAGSATCLSPARPPAAAGASSSVAGPAIGSPLRFGRQQQQQQQQAYSPQQQQQNQQQRQAGRYDAALCSQSPSPEQSFGPAAGLQEQEPSSRDLSPVASTSSSPSRVQCGSLSPTARRLLQHAQQQQHQQQQPWELDASSWQQQEQLEQHFEQHMERQQLEHQQQFEEEDAYGSGGGGLPLTEQPSEQWRALEQLGSAQHLLAAIEHSPASSPVRSALQQQAAGGGAFVSAGPAAAAAAASPRPGQLAVVDAAGSSASSKPRPRSHSRGMSRTPGLVSPSSSPDSPVREDIGVYSGHALETWGSRIATRPASPNSSWAAGQHPQQPQHLDVGAEGQPLPGVLSAQGSYLEANNPMQSPAELRAQQQGCAPQHSSREPARRLSVGALPVPEQQQRSSSRVGAAASAPASPAPGALWHGGAARAAAVASPTPSEAAESAVRAFPRAASAHGVVDAGAASAAASGSSSSPSTLRKSVSWGDRPQQQQPVQVKEQTELARRDSGSPPAAAAARGPLFAEDVVPGACSMYSPYVPAARQQQQAHSNQHQQLAGPEAAAAAAPPAQQHRAPHPLECAGAGPPAASPALSAAAGGPPSDAAGVLELSDLSGLSGNASPSSVRFGGHCAAHQPPQHQQHSMSYNVLYSVYGEGRSMEHSDDATSGQLSTPRSGTTSLEGAVTGGSVTGGVTGGAGAGATGGLYETRDLLSRPPQRVVSAGQRGVQHVGGNSPGAHGELSFAVQGQQSPGSSLGESWLAVAAAANKQLAAGRGGGAAAAGLLGQMQQAQEQEPAAGPPGDMHEPWELLPLDEDSMQLESPASGPSGTQEHHAAQQAASAVGSTTGAAAVYHSDRLPPAAPPAASAQSAPAAIGASAAAEAAAAAAPAGAGAYCGSSRASFSSSMDLSPIKRQLFKAVSHSCHSLLEDAAGLSNIAAQLGVAAHAADGHGSREAVQAGRQALMAKQQRLQLHNRVQQGQGVPEQAATGTDGGAADGQQEQPSVTLHGSRVSAAARKALSSSAETASSWAASSVTPYVNEATAAAEAALAAADAAAQMSAACPATLMLQAYAELHHGSSSAATSEPDTASGGAAATQQAAGHAVLMGLTPVVPGERGDRSSRPQDAAAAADSPADTDPTVSPRPGPAAHGTDAVAKALFPAAVAGGGGAGAAAAAGSAPASPARAAPAHSRGGGAVAAVSSLPASPAPAAAAAGPASSTVAASGASASLPASPAAAARLGLLTSRDTLGPRSTAALAELQSQLLTIAVEKAALQRQLHAGRTEVEKLQEKACKTDQLEHVVQQMRSDLQQATHMLEHTGGAVQEQAQLNHQLQEQMQQLQQQIWTSEAERSRQAAAGTLAKISLCRRVLRHYADAAAVTGQWRRLKHAAVQRGRRLAQRRAFSVWRSGVEQASAVRALQKRHDQRRMAAAMAAWAQSAWEQRLLASQEQAADAHWASCTGRRAVALWLFYTQQVRRLGIDLPSPSTAPSSLQCSPRLRPEQQPAAAASSSSSAAAAAAAAKSGKQLLSTGLVSLTERLSGALSPPRAGLLHASRRLTTGGFELLQAQQQQSRHKASAMLASLSVPGVDPSSPDKGCAAAPAAAPTAAAVHAAGPSARHSHAAAPPAVARRSSGAGAAAAGRGDGNAVPLALQASFASASRSHRLRRRWLLVKAFNRWCQLIKVQAAERSRLAAAARHAARRLQRRTWAGWQQYVQSTPDKQQSDANSPLQQHLRAQQQRLLLRVVAAWSAHAREADLRCRTADILARQQRQRMQRRVLGALADHAVLQHVKRCGRHRADKHRLRGLLHRAWCGWRDSIGSLHADAAWQAQHSQQLLARVVCRWQQLSAAVTAAAAAGATEGRLALLQRRRQLSMLRASFGAWRLCAVQAAELAAAVAAGAAQEQVQQLQAQQCEDQQQLRRLPELLHHQAELQQQLTAASAARLELEHAVERQQQQLQQQAAQYQQQMAALQSEHRLGVTVLQEQLQQASASADETMQQLQHLQHQHQQLQVEQQAQQLHLEQQLVQQRQELELQARQQQQQSTQQQRQDQRLTEQLATRKAQCHELAAQLKRCTDKLNSQTAAVQAVKAELCDTQTQLAAARAASRNKSLTLTEKAVAAERGRSELEQQLAQHELDNRQLRQQLAEAQAQLQQQRGATEARAVAAAAGQGAEVLRLQEQLGQKDEVIGQLRDSMGAVQAQLASQQAKVLSEVTELRNGWSQAKQIIKQQRKTIKAQEMQLRLLDSGGAAGHVSWSDQGQPLQQRSASAAAGAETAAGVLKFPITSWLLQRQQQQQGPSSSGRAAGVGVALGATPSSSHQAVLAQTSELLQSTDGLLRSLRPGGAA